MALSFYSSETRCQSLCEQDIRVVGLSVVGSGLSLAGSYKLLHDKKVSEYITSSLIMMLGACLIITSKEIIAEYDVYVIKRTIQQNVFNWASFLKWWKEQRQV